MTDGFIDVADGRVWYTIAGEDRGGTPLLCLHGGPGMPHDYLEPLGDLSDDRPVIFYDQLGCGRSPAPDSGVTWTVQRFVDELVAVRQALPFDEVVLFGNSWGGMLALQYMLDRSPQLRGLILSSTPVSVSRWLADAAQLRSELPDDVQAVLDSHERSGFFSCPEYQGAVAEFYRRHLCRLSPWPDCIERTFMGLGVDVYSTLWGPSEFGPVTGELVNFEVVDRLHQITVPTLVTGGRFDEARPEHMELLARSIPGAELAVFEHSAHVAFVEERYEYMTRLRQFLTRIDAGA
ncbi:MAG TPA: proline iminopeptidase-family hydrolase [Candidatus Acidoferrales bacterium]|nr:proline iminopeptidase-family hydrolase [Candidatus Acidoferrales bacterium]